MRWRRVQVDARVGVSLVAKWRAARVGRLELGGGASWGGGKRRGGVSPLEDGRVSAAKARERNRRSCAPHHSVAWDEVRRTRASAPKLEGSSGKGRGRPTPRLTDQGAPGSGAALPGPIAHLGLDSSEATIELEPKRRGVSTRGSKPTRHELDSRTSPPPARRRPT